VHWLALVSGAQWLPLPPHVHYFPRMPDGNMGTLCDSTTKMEYPSRSAHLADLELGVGADDDLWEALGCGDQLVAQRLLLLLHALAKLVRVLRSGMEYGYDYCNYCCEDLEGLAVMVVQLVAQRLLLPLHTLAKLDRVLRFSVGIQSYIIALIAIEFKRNLAVIAASLSRSACCSPSTPSQKLSGSAVSGVILLAAMMR